MGFESVRGLVVLLLGLSPLVSAAEARLAQPPEDRSGRYICRVWTTEDGLPQNTITAIVQTHDGYIWLGTLGGLARFDGVAFTLFDAENTETLKSNRILSLCEDRRGTLWIGTEAGGLTQYDRGAWTRYTVDDGLPSDTILSIVEDGDGALWINTPVGLGRWRDGAFLPCTTGEGKLLEHVSAFCPDREGTLWVGLWGGRLAHLRDGVLTTILTPTGDVRHWVHAIEQGRDGSLWVGTHNGLFRLRDGTVTRYTTANGLSDNFIECLLEDRAGSLWVGTRAGGLNRWAEGAWTTTATNNGLSGEEVRCLMEDREGDLWIGTSGGGLIQQKRQKLTVLSTEQGLPDEEVVPITEDGEGNIWIGATCGGLVRLAAGKLTTYTPGRGLPPECIWSLAADRDGSLWIGSWGGGVTRFKDGYFTTYTRSNSNLSDDVVLALYQDRAGRLWVGTQHGLNQFHDGTFTVYRKADGLVHDDVRFITEDAQGALWIGTLGGLSRFQDGTFTNYTTEQGLSNSYVRAIYQGADGALWIGTYGGGLNRFKEGRFTAITRRDGLFDNVVSRILEDDRGNLWMSGNRGIFRVSLRQLNDFADDRIGSVTSISYGLADGMEVSECNGGSQPAGWRTRDGRLWFPTISGIVIIDPSDLNEQPPLVHIERVLIDDALMDRRRRIKAPPGPGDVEIHYTGLCFQAPEKMRFKYKLEGFDGHWVDAGSRRVAYYTKVPPGDYRFRVLAMNNDGVWSEREAAIEISLAPHVYQTGWFYALVVGMLLAAGWGGYKLQVKRLEQRTRELEAMVAARTAEVVQHRNQLASANRQLERVNTNMLSILNQFHQGAVITDAEGRVTFVSQAAERLLERRQDEVLGQHWTTLFPLSAPDRNQLKVLLDQPPNPPSKIPIAFHARTGRRYWIEIEVVVDPRRADHRIFFLHDVSEVYDLRQLLGDKTKFHDLIGGSRAMKLVYEQIQDLARVDTIILITGETGTGKELVARAVHYASRRRDKPFIAVNCAGLTESLVASQLFGHRRGAFTGAVADQQGVFEAAEGGTLLLDEIGDLSLPLQATLLRVLQEKEIIRLGESKPRQIDVRVVAATHHNLHQDVAAGRFRPDLLYRISAAEIHLPPLRERPSDIPLLVAWFLGQLRAESGKRMPDVSQEVIHVLMTYPWPGNVRELKSAIEWAAVRCKGTIIQIGDLPAKLGGTPPPNSSVDDGRRDESRRILEALEQSGGQRAAAARRLGISRSTLYRRLKRLGLSDE